MKGCVSILSPKVDISPLTQQVLHNVFITGGGREREEGRERVGKDWRCMSACSTLHYQMTSYPITLPEFINSHWIKRFTMIYQQLRLTHDRWPALERSTRGRRLVCLCRHSSPPSAAPLLAGRSLLPSWEVTLPPDWTNSPEWDPPPRSLWLAGNFLYTHKYGDINKQIHILDCVFYFSVITHLSYKQNTISTSIQCNSPNLSALNTSGLLLSSSVKKRARRRTEESSDNTL